MPAEMRRLDANQSRDQNSASGTRLSRPVQENAARRMAAHDTGSCSSHRWHLWWQLLLLLRQQQLLLLMLLAQLLLLLLLLQKLLLLLHQLLLLMILQPQMHRGLLRLSRPRVDSHASM